MTISDLQKQIGELAQKEEKKEYKEYLQIHKESYAHQFNKATAYATVITMAGYAGLFTIWNLTKDYLSPKVAYSAALFATISLVLFVMYEVYKMCVYERQFDRVNKAFHTPLPYPKIMEALKGAETENVAEQLRQARIWPWVFGTTVVTGLIAAFILINAFVVGLYSELFVR